MEPPYTISITAEERGASDDEFTDGTINLGIDLGSLQGSVSTTTSQKPGDKDDNDTDDDDPNAPEDPDEQASYTITYSGEITPAVEIGGDDDDGLGPIDFRGRKVTFSVMPQNIRGTVDILLHGAGGQTVTLLRDELSQALMTYRSSSLGRAFRT